VGHGVRRWLVPVVVAVVAAVVGSGSVILFVDTGTAAGAAVALESATSTGADPFTRSVTIGEVAHFPGSIHRITRTVTAELDPDPTTGGLTTTGNAPGLYGGTGNEHVCNPTQLADSLVHTPDKAAAWAATLGITVHEIPHYISTLTPVVLTTDTRVTNHGYAHGGATPRPAVLQAGTAVLVDRYGTPRVKCGCGNPLTEPATTPIATTTGHPWPTYQPDTVTTITPTPQPQTDLTLTNIQTGHTYTQPTGAAGGGTWLAVTTKGFAGPSDYVATALASADARTWKPVTADCSSCDFMNSLSAGAGKWVATATSQGDGYLEVSSDGGKTWTEGTPAPAGSQQPLAAVAYGDGHWIVLGQDAYPSKAAIEYSSTDGATWSRATTTGLPGDDYLSGVDWHWNSVTFGHGTWVALATDCAGVCRESVMFTSTDGTTWHQSDQPFNDEARVAYGNGRWMVAANAGRGISADATPDSTAVVSTSTDLQHWSEGSGPAAFGQALAFGHGTFLFAAFSSPSGASDGTQLFSSRDGRTWSRTATLDGALSALAFGGS